MLVPKELGAVAGGAVGSALNRWPFVMTGGLAACIALSGGAVAIFVHWGLGLPPLAFGLLLGAYVALKWRRSVAIAAAHRLAAEVGRDPWAR